MSEPDASNPTSRSLKLFAVYVGGRAPKCRIELHDVAFVVGDSIESCYESLMDQWFGDPCSIHIDGWIELDIVDGYQVQLLPDRPAHAEKLWFINLGAYQPGELTELHKCTFLVDTDADRVKRRAKASCLRGFVSVHKDDLFDIDDCLQLNEVGGYYVHLERTTQVSHTEIICGYHTIPRAFVNAYAQRKGL